MAEYIESNRLTFSKFQTEDRDFINSLLTNKDVCKYLPVKESYSLDITNKVFEYYFNNFSVDTLNLAYIIKRKDNNQTIGYGGIQMVKEFNQPEIFYILDPIGWNQGFASETAFRMKELAMDLNIKYIIGLADIENIASQRVLEKIGYNKIEQLDLWGVTLFFYDMKL